MTTTPATCASPVLMLVVGPCCVSESEGHVSAHHAEEVMRSGRWLSGRCGHCGLCSACWGDTCDHSRRKPLPRASFLVWETDSKDSFLKGDGETAREGGLMFCDWEGWVGCTLMDVGTLGELSQELAGEALSPGDTWGKCCQRSAAFGWKNT